MNESFLLNKIVVNNFRGLNDLTIDDLARVNIFVGANNSGKTSMLEAIKIMSDPTDIGLLVQTALHRIQSSAEAKKKNLVNYLLSAFQKDNDNDDPVNFYRIKLGASVAGQVYNYEADGLLNNVVNSSGSSQKALGLTIKLSSKSSSKPSYQSVDIINGIENKFPATEKKLYPSLYVSTHASYYRTCVVLLSDYIVYENKSEILKILQTFDVNIEDISIVGEDIYIQNSVSGLMPLFTYGSGLQKALCLTAAIVYCKNGTILIDEIDNGIHVSAFEDVFNWFFDACIENDVQAFVTTHSAEALDAILRVVHEKHENDDILRIITLRKNSQSGKIGTKIRSGAEAYEDRVHYKQELRV